MATSDRYRNPHYYRDYFRNMGEARREYLRKRYAANPSRQALAARKYRAKPEVKARVREYLREYTNRPDVKARLKARRARVRLQEQAKRLARILARYGVTLDWYQHTGAAQNWRCAICGSDNPGVSRCERLHVDHCHKTNKPRGLLCNGCNRGLGYFGDRPAVLFAAAQYLLKHQSISEVG